MKNNSLKLNTLFGILIAALVLITFLLNAVMFTLSQRYPLSTDLNANAAYHVGEDTKAVLDMVTDDLELYVLSAKEDLSGNSYLTQVQKILEEYPKHSGHIRLTYIDYVSDPTFAANYPNLELSTGDVLIVGPESVKQVPLASMFNYTYDASGSLTVLSSRAEEAVTSGIVSVISPDPVRIAFLAGSGVSEDTDALRSILSDNNFKVEQANLVSDDFSRYDILLLLAPTSDLSEDSLKKLDSFLYNDGEYGKMLLYSADVNQPELPNVAAFLREWGIEVGDGAVFETEGSHAYSYQPYYPLVEYRDETFRDLLKDSTNPVLMPLSRPLSALFSYRNNRTVTELLSFYDTSGVRPSAADDTFTASQATVRGPMPAMLLSTMQIAKADGETGKSNVLVCASTSALGASAVSNTSLNNANYLVTVFNRLFERENAVSIEAKSLAGNLLGISTAAASTWGIVLCVVIPLLILGAGIAIFLSRRHK